MLLKNFAIEYPEDSDISPEKIYRCLTTRAHICPGARVTICEILETGRREEEYINCCKCGKVLSVVRHHRDNLTCKECT